jgi:amino acid transporter
MPHRHVPPYAMIVGAVVPAIIILGSVVSTKALTSIISFATLGIYLGFQMVVLAALRARLKGWQPSGTFRLGTWGLPVTAAALAYGITAMVIMAWPRTPDVPWYDNWIVALSAALGTGVGLVYLVLAKPYQKTDAISGDAIPGEATPPQTPTPHV